LGQHKGLYQAYKSLRESAEFEKLSVPQRKVVENALRDFKLSGIGLPEEKQKRYGEISARLSDLSSQFNNNVLDATMGWTKLITNVKDLSGLPESAIAAAKAQAEAKGQKGWLLTLEAPSYQPVITYADNRELRREIYHAYN
ncbi:oligopeptidase A, partial [Enterobacter hormaechei]|nr:oligopeptidase A [Enterobacter hormaechei]